MRFLRVTLQVPIPDDVGVEDMKEAVKSVLNSPLGPEEANCLIYDWHKGLSMTLVDTTPRCASCGTTEDLYEDRGSNGPYRCHSNSCVVF